MKEKYLKHVLVNDPKEIFMKIFIKYNNFYIKHYKYLNKQMHINMVLIF